MKPSHTPKQKNLIKPGEMFQLGSHRLACGDATNDELVKKLVGKDTIDLILTDPPYGVLYTQAKAGFSKVKVNKEIINDDITSEFDYAVFTKNWLVAITPHLSKKDAIYIFNSDKMLFALRDGMEQAGVNFSQLLIWIKNHAVVGRKDYLPMHELIAYGWHGTHLFHKSKDKSVLFYPKPSKSSLHPTTKPVPLLRHLILNSSKIGSVIYDCFGGSGSTLIAAEQTRRKCLMVELDPDYCQTIITRFEKLTGIKSSKIN